jgi:hypothetical protein
MRQQYNCNESDHIRLHAWQECTRGLPSADHVFLLPESSMLALIFSSFLRARGRVARRSGERRRGSRRGGRAEAAGPQRTHSEAEYTK